MMVGVELPAKLMGMELSLSVSLSFYYLFNHFIF